MGLNVNMGAVIVLVGLLVGLLVTTVNSTEDDRELRPLPISMRVALEVAEAAAPGQGLIAELDIVGGRPVYEIHILGVDHSLSTVHVDAQDGKVTVVRERQEQTKQRKDFSLTKEERYDLQISIYYRSHGLEPGNGSVHICGGTET